MNLKGALVLTLLVSGCVTQQTHENIYLGPHLTQDQIRSFVLENKNRLFVDPDSVRDAGITIPYATPRARTTFCLQLNARNRMGGYTGLQEMVVFVHPNGQFETHTVTDPNDSCNLPFRPFPELTTASPHRLG